MRYAAFLGLLMMAGQASAQSAGIDETERNFGEVARGTIVKEEFTLANTGDAPLLVTGMRFSTPGLRARVAKSIAPGTGATLVIEWDTSQYVRDVVGQAEIEINDPRRPTIVLTLNGMVISPIDISPAPAFYLSGFEGEAAAQTVAISINQDRDVAVTGVAATSKLVEVAIASPEPGRRHEITAKIRPGLAPGRHSDAIHILTDDQDRRRIRLEINVLVKTDPFVSIEAIDLGRHRIAGLRASQSRLDLVGETFILEGRDEMEIVNATTDLPFLTLASEPRGRAKLHRFDVGLLAKALTIGEHHGVLHITTDRGPIELPVNLTLDP